MQQCQAPDLQYLEYSTNNNIMRTNQEYKNASLDKLKGNWSPAVLATVIFAFIALLCSSQSFLPSTMLSYGAMAGLAGASSMLAVFVLLPLEYGYYNSLRRFFNYGETEVVSNMVTYATTNYLHVVWTLFLMGLKILLWTLLLVIPGIIKAFAYAMTPFIMADYPDLSASEAIAESERLMKGHKFDLFYLILSFLGWAILCVFTMGIGAFWLEPYMIGAMVGFYNDLKAEKALA